VIDAISVPKAEQLKTFLLDERLALAGEVMEKCRRPINSSSVLAPRIS